MKLFYPLTLRVKVTVGCKTCILERVQMPRARSDCLEKLQALSYPSTEKSNGKSGQDPFVLDSSVITSLASSMFTSAGGSRGESILFLPTPYTNPRAVYATKGSYSCSYAPVVCSGRSPAEVLRRS